jgi:predicted enzyme related to lactoylglutathione lyase
VPEIDRYENGVPSWVDIGSPDVAGSVAFYTALFGWEAQDMGEEAGGYHMATKMGRFVAGIGSAQDPGPPRWATYINVDDIEAVAKAAEAAGGQVVVAPMEVMTAGRLAVLRDTTGAFVSAWQPGMHKGAQLVNETGAFTWCELHTSDLARSKAFYSEVFGWGWGGTDDYAEGQVAGRTVAGVMPRRPDMPAEVPDNWQVYFGADDTDAATAKATELGATLIVPPMDIPGTGRFSVLADPQGATFALFKA